MATKYTHLKLKPEYRDKLKKLADANKRSMAKELEMLIDKESMLNDANNAVLSDGVR